MRLCLQKKGKISDGNRNLRCFKLDEIRISLYKNGIKNQILRIKRFPKPSLSSQQADGVLRSASRRKRQESLILERPKNSTPEFLVSIIAKSDDAAELRGIKPNLAIN